MEDSNKKDEKSEATAVVAAVATSRSKQLEDEYVKFEKSIICTNGQPNAYSHLPHFNGNKNQPIHRWFTYKEGFSSELLSWVCKTIGTDITDIESLLDPYLGVATSLLSAQLIYRGTHDLTLVGVERNPFAAFVSRAKLKWQSYDQDKIKELIPKLVEAIKKRNVKFGLMDLSTIQDQRIFNRRRLQDLLFARYIIGETLTDTNEHDFFLLGWASIIETVSNVRKDGRALRIVEKDDRPAIHVLLESRWNEMLGDLRTAWDSLKEAKRGEVHTTVYEGDGRTLVALPDPDQRFDLILYSPPYLNNIDYSEVYKLELWLMGLVSSRQDFKKLRLSTFRSHPSVRFFETDYIESLGQNTWPRRLVEALVSNLARDKDFQWRSRLIKAYADDMLVSLSSQFVRAKPGAHVVCVVGNSLHGKKESATPVATDLIIAAIAQEVGFEIDRLQVTRHTNRRSREHPVRESVIIMRRPTR
jgi:hypothetical protein